MNDWEFAHRIWAQFHGDDGALKVGGAHKTRLYGEYGEGGDCETIGVPGVLNRAVFHVREQREEIRGRIRGLFDGVAPYSEEELRATGPPGWLFLNALVPWRTSGGRERS